MRKILEKILGPVPASVAVTLEYSDRQKSRGLLKLDDGSEAALLLERGTGLHHGDRLLADDGTIVLVQAALEGLSVVTASDPLDLCRAAYHLGNRHVALQISALRLAYLHDHVLDDMVRELGFNVSFSAERFEPESGAYGHGHAHASRPPASYSHGHEPHGHEPHGHEPHGHEHHVHEPHVHEPHGHEHHVHEPHVHEPHGHEHHGHEHHEQRPSSAGRAHALP